VEFALLAADLLLPDGSYRVTALATDSAGNTGSQTTMGEVEIDNRPPVPVIHPWQNPGVREDVNGDGIVTPVDVLVLINTVNSRGAGPLPAARTPADQSMPFVDVNGDDALSPLDVLAVINFLNATSASQPAPEAEGPDLLPGELPVGLRETDTVAGRESARRPASSADLRLAEQTGPSHRVEEVRETPAKLASRFGLEDVLDEIASDVANAHGMLRVSASSRSRAAAVRSASKLWTHPAVPGFPDPIQLVWMVNEIGELNGAPAGIGSTPASLPRG
jgi:hypothetical protein